MSIKKRVLSSVMAVITVASMVGTVSASADGWTTYGDDSKMKVYTQLIDGKQEPMFELKDTAVDDPLYLTEHYYKYNHDGRHIEFVKGSTNAKKLRELVDAPIPFDIGINQEKRTVLVDAASDSFKFINPEDGTICDNSVYFHIGYGKTVALNGLDNDGNLIRVCTLAGDDICDYNLAALSAGGRIALSWDEVRHAEKYCIAYATEGSGRWKIYDNNISPNTTSWISPKLPVGRTYLVAIAAKIDGKWITNTKRSPSDACYAEVTIKK